MRIGYLDCFSGISGDMMLGALVDAGVTFAHFEETVAALNVGARLEMRKVSRGGIAGTKVDVIVPGQSAPSPTHSHSHAEADHTHGTHSHGGHAHEPHSHSASTLAPHRHLSSILAIIHLLGSALCSRISETLFHKGLCRPAHGALPSQPNREVVDSRFIVHSLFMLTQLPPFV